VAEGENGGSCIYWSARSARLGSLHTLTLVLHQLPLRVKLRSTGTLLPLCLGFILVAGILSNFLTLLIFAKFRSLWTPINLILLNISLSDILVCVFGTPFSFAASLHGSWLIGEYGCKWYGFANSLFDVICSRNIKI
uniref:Teleost multiple tissue opsin 3a n=1 Tax=Oreochromis niloticus TaxID=8128 RepID=A0A669DQ35_ORENI